MAAQNKIAEFVDRLIQEAGAVLDSKWQPGGNWVSGPPTYVDLELFETWSGRCRLLHSMLGPYAAPWTPIIADRAKNEYGAAKRILGALKAIQLSIREGLLIRFEDLILADAFSDILEQAEYLLSQGYYLAAGVLARAVIEERLRRMCQSRNCMPARDRPTLADFNAELYKATVYDKITLKHIEALAAVGNEAAHNGPNLTRDDVQRLLSGTREILQRFAT